LELRWYFSVFALEGESLVYTHHHMKSMVTPLTRVLPFRHPNGHNTLPFSLTRYPSSPNFSFSPLTLTLSMAASPQSSAPVPLFSPSFHHFFFHPIEPYLACTLQNLNFESLDWNLEYFGFCLFSCLFFFIVWLKFWIARLYKVFVLLVTINFHE